MNPLESIVPEVEVVPVQPVAPSLTADEWADEVGLIDWDTLIIEPPPRSSQTILVRFVEGGRRPIRIEEDPRD